MSKKITYYQALNKIAYLEKRITTEAKINIFDKSLILSHLFDMDKDIILEELLKKTRGNKNE